VVVVFTQDNSYSTFLELFYTCIGLISIFFVKAPTAALVVAVVVVAVALVFSDNRAYPN
jgi:ABC-type multidrug transport system permease subunit